MLGAVAIIGWFITGTIRETMSLHADGYDHAAYLGDQLAKLTRPEDEIVVIGTRYHPAVEWYARRDVHFLDTSGAIEEIVARDHPNLVVVFPLRASFEEQDDSGQDRASGLVGARADEARQYAEQHGHEMHRTETLLLFELPTAPKNVAPRE